MSKDTTGNEFKFVEPEVYYRTISSVESSMEYSVHELIKGYGRKTTGKTGCTRYFLSLKDRICPCYVINNKGKRVKVVSAQIHNPEQCQRMAHIILKDEQGFIVTIDNYQWFNVYSAAYRKCVKKHYRRK